MMHRLCFVLVAFPLAASADTLYKCTEDGGQVLYTNQKSSSKKCTVLSREQSLSNFTAPKGKAGSASPTDFPRVSGDQQKARDGDRRTILNQELANEQKLLDAAKKALLEQESTILPEERAVGGKVQGAKREERLQSFRDSVQLHERNIEALNKEIGNLK